MQTILRAQLGLPTFLPALTVPFCSKGNIMVTEEAAVGPLVTRWSRFPFSDLGVLTYEQKKKYCCCSTSKRVNVRNEHPTCNTENGQKPFDSMLK